jgi:hypothetical protein
MFQATPQKNLGVDAIFMRTTSAEKDQNRYSRSLIPAAKRIFAPLVRRCKTIEFLSAKQRH